MARRQFHVGYVADVPGVDDDASRVRIIFNLVHGITDLIYAKSAPVTPLVAINRTKVAVVICPGIPDWSVLS